MSQISKALFGALAVTLTFGAVQLVTGQDATGQEYASGQEFAGRFQAVMEKEGADINRSAKGNREANIPAPVPTRTIALRVDSVADTSVLVRVPVAKEARNMTPEPAAKPAQNRSNRKMAVACEPTVSVLTEVAKLLQPGRCVT